MGRWAGALAAADGAASRVGGVKTVATGSPPGPLIAVVVSFSYFPALLPTQSHKNPIRDVTSKSNSLTVSLHGQDQRLD